MRYLKKKNLFQIDDPDRVPAEKRKASPQAVIIIKLF